MTRSERIAVAAALAASLGDLLMLYVTGSRRPELSLPQAPISLLALGGLLGVLAIPLYSLGYRCAAGLVEDVSVSGARWVFVLGTIGAALGAVIHGLTALHIHCDIVSGTAAGDPLTSIAGWGGTIVLLWAAAATVMLAASLVFWRLAAFGFGRGLRLEALANPALVTAALALAGSVTLGLRAFLVPAAPNLAHVVFFAACARVRKIGFDPRRGRRAPATIFAGRSGRKEGSA